MNARKLSWIFMTAAVVAIVFNLWIRKDAATEEPATQPVSQQAGQVADLSGSSATSPEASTQMASIPADGKKFFTNELAAPQEILLGSLDPVTDYVLQMQLTSRGAATQYARLANYFSTVADKKRYHDNPGTYEQAVRENPKKYQGHYSVLNPVGPENQIPVLPMETDSLRLKVGDRPEEIILLAGLNWRPLPVQTTENSQTVSFELDIYLGRSSQDAQPVLKLIKSYTVNKNDYSVSVDLAMENLCDQPLVATVDQDGPVGVTSEDLRMDMRRAAYAYIKDGEVVTQLKNVSELEGKKPGPPKVIGSSDSNTPMLWIGDTNKFFASILYVKPTIEGRLAASDWQAEFYLQNVRASQTQLAYATGVRISAVKIDPDQQKTVQFSLYVGPKDRGIFINEENKYFNPLYKNLRYIDTIEFGGCFLSFSSLTLGMMWLLEKLAILSFGNYGVAIILLVLLVRLILHPLTKKSQVAMMGMSKMAPKIQQLKEKYADDKDTLNREMMKVYKENGTTPLLGCLPMLLQMPIWIALYTGINASVSLRHAAFLPVWITDLAAPDALFRFPMEIPFVGSTFNLLPILLAIAMFLQQKYMPQSQTAAASPEQIQQQKMMKIMFPAMMLIFFYNSPSGLTLYIMASTFAGILDSYFVRKHIEKKDAEEAAAQTTVVVPGKTARSSRPKKPKGPNWVKH